MQYCAYLGIEKVCMPVDFKDRMDLYSEVISNTAMSSNFINTLYTAYRSIFLLSTESV